VPGLTRRTVEAAQAGASEYMLSLVTSRASASACFPSDDAATSSSIVPAAAPGGWH
jgi:hypothetical protein